MFFVVITRIPNGLVRQFLFGTLPEARQYFDHVIRENQYGRVQIRLIEKRDYCHSFLLDSCIIKSAVGKQPKSRAGN